MHLIDGAIAAYAAYAAILYSGPSTETDAAEWCENIAYWLQPFARFSIEVQGIFDGTLTFWQLTRSLPRSSITASTIRI